MAREDILSTMKSNKACTICYDHTHHAKECQLPPCKINNCGRKHSRFVHVDHKDNIKKNQQPAKDQSESQGQPKSNITYHPTHQAICKSVQAYIVAPDGCRQTVRVILDSWSEVTLIRRDTADTLGLNGTECTLQLVTSGNKTQQFRHQKKVRFELESLNGNYRSQMITASTAPEIAGPIRRITFNPKIYQHLKDITFTESYPKSASTDTMVDVMVGEPLYSDLLIGAPIKGRDTNEPIAQETKLGFCLAGAMLSQSKNMSQAHYSCRTSLTPLELDLQSFWNLKHIGIKHQPSYEYTMEEKMAIDKAKELTVKENNHWTTGLLWQPDAPNISNNNYRKATAIMKSVEKRMTPEKLKQVNDSYSSWLEQDFAEPLPPHETATYYLETHPVFEEDRNTKC